MLAEIILYVLAVVLVIAGIAAGVLKVIRNKVKRELKIRTPNGIQISEKVMIGGIPQWIQIRGEDRSNPILFFIHGGPGAAVTNLAHSYQKEWEKHFTVVNWDQRASGKTRFESNTEEVKKTVTMDRLIEDGREVAEHIRKRIGQNSVVVLGQSWGSVLGSLLVLKHPNLFTAYIGTGQVVDMEKGFQIGYEHVLSLSEAAGDKETCKNLVEVKQLEREGKISIFDKKYLNAYTPALYKYGVASFKVRSLQKYAFLALRTMLTSPENTVYEVLSHNLIKKNTISLFDDFCKSSAFSKFKLDKFSTEFSVPYYQINGDNDWHTPFTLAKEYFDRVKAPGKRWHTLKDAGHLAQLDNLSDFTRCLMEIRPELFG